VAATERLRGQVLDLEKRSRDLLVRSLRGVASELLGRATGAPPLVVASYSGWTPEDLRALATEIVRRGSAVVLLGSAGEKAHLVFAQSEGLSKDIPGLLREAASTLGGKGGGTPRLAQGGGSKVEKLQEALDTAAARVREP
jgi:alanyl-tRNA synthetase